jgi:hypothetical protein
MTVQRVLLQDPGAIGYFHNFLLKAPWPSKFVVGVFFAFFLALPFISGPEKDGSPAANMIVSACTLLLVYLLTLAALILFNRRLSGTERKTGEMIVKLTATPLILYAAVLVVAIANMKTLDEIVNLTSTVLTILPVLLILVMLLQLILSRGRYQHVQVGGFYLTGIYFLAVFLVIFTFATGYWLNGWYDPGAQQKVSFLDVMYMSGLDFSTLGFVGMQPVGPGKALAILEAVSSYFLMALMAASFLAIINDAAPKSPEGEE